MRVYIERASMQGRKSKGAPPTTFCELTEIKIYRGEFHSDSEWFVETDNLGNLLVELEAYEDVSIKFYTLGETAHITIYDDYLE